MRSIERLPEAACSSIRSGVLLFDLTRVVEELVFNSLDAGATKVSIALDVDTCCVKVADNGYGVTREELVLLGERYATSKFELMAGTDALNGTFGFRGEALGSISDVSLLEIVTKAHGMPNGYRKVIKGCKCLYLGIDDVRQDVGTTAAMNLAVTVRDLFYNQPVRRKHLQSSPRKILHSIRESVLKIALVHLKVSFRVTDMESGEELLCTHSSSSPLSLLMSGFGLEVSSSLHDLDVTDHLLRLSGYASVPSFNFSVKAIQYFYINSRFISKGPIHKLLNQVAARFSCLDAMKDNIDCHKGKQSRCQMFATYILNLRCPRARYDLTFEPSKTTVEFKDWDPVLSFIEDSLSHFWSQKISPVQEDSLILAADKSPKQNKWEEGAPTLPALEGLLTKEGKRKSNRDQSPKNSRRFLSPQHAWVSKESGHMSTRNSSRFSFGNSSEDGCQLEDQHTEMEFSSQPDLSFLSSDESLEQRRTIAKESDCHVMRFSEDGCQLENQQTEMEFGFNPNLSFLSRDDSLAQCRAAVPHESDSHVGIPGRYISSAEDRNHQNEFAIQRTNECVDLSTFRWERVVPKFDLYKSSVLSDGHLEIGNCVGMVEDHKIPLKSGSTQMNFLLDGPCPAYIDEAEFQADGFRRKKRLRTSDWDDIDEVKGIEYGIVPRSNSSRHNGLPGDCFEIANDVEKGLEYFEKPSLRSWCSPESLKPDEMRLLLDGPCPANIDEPEFQADGFRRKKQLRTNDWDDIEEVEDIEHDIVPRSHSSRSSGLPGDCFEMVNDVEKGDEYFEKPSQRSWHSPESLNPDETSLLLDGPCPANIDEAEFQADGFRRKKGLRTNDWDDIDKVKGIEYDIVPRSNSGRHNGLPGDCFKIANDVEKGDEYFAKPSLRSRCSPESVRPDELSLLLDGPCPANIDEAEFQADGFRRKKQLRTNDWDDIEEVEDIEHDIVPRSNSSRSNGLPRDCFEIANDVGKGDQYFEKPSLRSWRSPESLKPDEMSFLLDGTCPTNIDESEFQADGFRRKKRLSTNDWDDIEEVKDIEHNIVPRSNSSGSNRLPRDCFKIANDVEKGDEYFAKHSLRSRCSPESFRPDEGACFANFEESEFQADGSRKKKRAPADDWNDIGKVNERGTRPIIYSNRSNVLSSHHLEIDNDAHMVNEDCKKPFLRNCSSRANLLVDRAYFAKFEGSVCRKKKRQVHIDDWNDNGDINNNEQGTELWQDGAATVWSAPGVTAGDPFTIKGKCFPEGDTYQPDPVSPVRLFEYRSRTADSEWYSLSGDPKIVSKDTKHYNDENVSTWPFKNHRTAGYEYIADTEGIDDILSLDRMKVSSTKVPYSLSGFVASPQALSVCTSGSRDTKEFKEDSTLFLEDSGNFLDERKWLKFDSFDKSENCKHVEASSHKSSLSYLNEDRKPNLHSRLVEKTRGCQRRSRRSCSAPPFCKERKKFFSVRNRPTFEKGKFQFESIHDIPTLQEACDLKRTKNSSNIDLPSPNVADDSWCNARKDKNTTADISETLNCEMECHTYNTTSIEDITSKEEGTLDSGSKWRNSCPSTTNMEKSDVLPCQDSILNIYSGILHLSGDLLVPKSISKKFLDNARVLQQVDRKFIPVVATGTLAIIDQHAADERIRLEDLRQKVLSGKMKTVTHLEAEKELALPEIGYQLLHNYAKQIQKWGWICNFYSQSSKSFKRNLNVLHKQPSVATLLAVPCILGVNLTDVDLLEFLQQLADTDGSSTIPQAVLRVLNFKACRGAIMFGDKLLLSECSLIVDELKQTSLCFQCAHGRPTTVPLVDLNVLQRQIQKLEMNSGSDKSWHGLRHHKPSLERAEQRLNSGSAQ